MAWDPFIMVHQVIPFDDFEISGLHRNKFPVLRASSNLIFFIRDFEQQQS